MPTTNITWQNLTNAVINGSGHLEKNAGANNCFQDASGTGDGGARSVEEIASGDFEFRCTLGPIAGEAGRSFVGLDSGGFSLDFSTWIYCWHVSTENNTVNPHPPRSIFVYEGSPPKKFHIDGAWDEGRLFRFLYQNGKMRYYFDNLLCYTSSRAITFPVFAVASLACLNKTVIDPQFITGQGLCAPGPYYP